MIRKYLKKNHSNYKNSIITTTTITVQRNKRLSLDSGLIYLFFEEEAGWIGNTCVMSRTLICTIVNGCIAVF